MTPLAQAHSEESTRFQILVAALRLENAMLREEHKHIQANLTLAEQKCVETTTLVKKIGGHAWCTITFARAKSYQSHY